MGYAKNWKVHVYRPSAPGKQGERYIILDIHCVTAETAVKKAKEKIYKMRKLAHYYTYVAILSDNQMELIK